MDRHSRVTVLDPACGSGNFLFVTLQKLKDLEKEVIDFGYGAGLTGILPLVGPWQLYGIESNPYAHDLAQMTIWIGYLQWQRDNGYFNSDDPILRATDHFRLMDAIMEVGEDGSVHEPEWPAVDYIVGNPPFLGDKIMRTELGDTYVESLRRLYKGRVPGGADLVTYWFERGRTELERGRASRIGLLATNAILYQLPFEYVRRVVRPIRETVRDSAMRTAWWLHGRRRPALRVASAGMPRYLVTPEVSKHRVFL